MLDAWLDQGILWFTQFFPDGSFFNLEWNVKGLLAVLLVSLICGSVGSLVVGNRMAFFSDALAHSAFAGVALGFLLALGAGVRDQADFAVWIMPVMVVFGILVGLAIAFVKDKTALANDTVIGVFFAGSMGFGAILLRLVSRRKYFNPEHFLFGELLTVTSTDLIVLFLLVIATAGVLYWIYNDLVFTSFNISLARSRRIRVRLCNYVFIVLLAVIVNVCLKAVGVLLINALLIVPAATAANLCRNLRQLFWGSIALCVVVGIAGLWLSWVVSVKTQADNPTDPITFGIGGVMVVLSVLLFFLSMLLAAFFRWWARRRSPALP
jgi:zinc transport system permease protein